MAATLGCGAAAAGREAEAAARRGRRKRKGRGWWWRGAAYVRSSAAQIGVVDDAAGAPEQIKIPSFSASVF